MLRPACSKWQQSVSDSLQSPNSSPLLLYKSLDLMSRRMRVFSKPLDGYPEKIYHGNPQFWRTQRSLVLFLWFCEICAVFQAKHLIDIKCMYNYGFQLIQVSHWLSGTIIHPLNCKHVHNWSMAVGVYDYISQVGLISGVFS